MHVEIIRCSSSIADLQVEYTGKGTITQGTRPGLVARFINWVFNNGLRRSAQRMDLDWMLGLASTVVGSVYAAPAVRIKDLANVQMGREIPLTGMGLVIGLEGTGDGRSPNLLFKCWPI